ncbi:MAG TPA: hypothetical protein VNW54_06385 [Granulicella sp.]|jgi:hypothetical protein|nr:hypothetical protein [Granulicella sp.]
MCAQIYTQPQSAPPEPHEKHEKRPHSNIEWLWQYSPSAQRPNGDEHALIQDSRFVPFLNQNLTAPQSFWGVQGTKYKPLADTAFDFLSVPGKVIADDNRYLSITGCVFHFCPSRGLLWVDLNQAAKNSPGPEHMVFFAATDWIREGKASTEPGAEYTLWVFPNQAFGLTPGDQHPIPSALVRSIARWTREPLAGSGEVENITRAIIVDPDGTPHQVPLATLGVSSSTPHTETEKP